MTNIQVKSHTRRKPEKPADPFQAEISRRLAQIREQAEADRAVNEYRNDVDWKRGPNPILIIAGKLKVLALRAKELVN